VQLINDTGVCHRDLKPDNILYDRESTSIKLIDFGVSKLVINRRKRSKDPMWTVTGTIQYKAPEMFEGSPGLI
jgi:serine/threonine protein kinase